VNEKLRDVSEPLAELAELAADSGPWHQVPDADLVRLTAAARAAGHRWDAIAAACDHGPARDIPGVIRQQYWIAPGPGPGFLFGATRRAARRSPTAPSPAGPSTLSSATRRTVPGWPATRPPTTRCGGTGCPG
jgi:hypothetical protein